jgi:LysM repeat protein
VVLSILFWWEGRNQTAVSDTETQPLAGDANAPATAVANLPAAPPTATPEPESDEPPRHIVQAGDTLGTISQLYDVTIEDIMAANELTNANIISVGQELIIPINGLEETAVVAAPVEPTSDSSIIPSPIPTQPATAGEAIVEIAQITGVGELAAEAVQIRNVGSSPIALRDWRLADQDGFFYTFGQVTLFGDGAGILVHTKAGPDGATEVYWGLESPVWKPGELITLLNGSGEIVATYSIP